MNIRALIKEILFPSKCILCRKLLKDNETDICTRCRTEVASDIKIKKSIPFVAGWTAVWYYEGDVRKSILRYKFRNARSYASGYGRFLAMAIQKAGLDQADILTWVPVSDRRRKKRGYDQCRLLAESVGSELSMIPEPCLVKIRDTAPQSRMVNAAQRKANILGAYRVPDPSRICGKRILILDDVVTTGATTSECARELMTAGAEKVFVAAIAATKSNKSR